LINEIAAAEEQRREDGKNGGDRQQDERVGSGDPVLKRISVRVVIEGRGQFDAAGGAFRSGNQFL